MTTALSTPSVSIIVPAYHEAGLDSIHAHFAGERGVELIFALAEDDAQTQPPPGAILARAPKGRARQMNAGAAVAHGNILLFLHADTRIEPGALDLIRLVCADRQTAMGAFSLQIAGAGWWYKAIAAMANLRSATLSMPFGDQAIFITRELFLKIGGYPDEPILEDVLLVKAAKPFGQIVILPSCAVTSPRRWEKDGMLAVTLKNWAIMLAHGLGAAPASIARWFPR